MKTIAEKIIEGLEEFSEELKTNPDLVPPRKPPKVGTTNPDDWIRALGDKIASMTPEDAKELELYLREKAVSKRRQRDL